MNRELLVFFDTGLKELLVALPAVYSVVEKDASLNQDGRWVRLQRHAEAISKSPLPVVTLLGPTASGKSTLFRLLTGLDVPAGSAVLPTTYNCLLAVPPSLPEFQLRDMFAGWRLEPLPEMSALRRPDLSQDQLFFKVLAVDRPAEGDFVLADVPDFSTTCLENWAKAELMMGRAEVVLFVVHKLSAADYQTMIYLSRACGLAGHLAFLLTMAEENEAQAIWQNLITQKCGSFRLREKDVGGDPAQPFEERRADGLTRAEFLAQADVYFSPRRDQPCLDDIRALRPEAPPLAGFLRGRNIARLMLTKRANDIGEGLKLAEETLHEHAREKKRFGEVRDRIRAQLASDDLDIVGRNLPLGEILDEVLAQAKERLPLWRKVAAKGVDWIWVGMRGGFRIVKNFFSDPTKAAALRRDEIEMRSLRDEAERLANQWRADFADAFPLNEEQCTNAVRALAKAHMPEPDEEWHDYARKRAGSWVTENPNKATLLLNSGAFVALLAGGLVTVDLFFTAGLVTLVSVKAAAVGGPATTAATVAAVGGIGGGVTALIASLLNRFVQKLGLGSVLKDFQAEWKKQRNAQLRAHLRDAFARPLLLDQVSARLAALEKAPVRECRQAVDTLQRLLAESLHPE